VDDTTVNFDHSIHEDIQMKHDIEVYRKALGVLENASDDELTYLLGNEPEIGFESTPEQAFWRLEFPRTKEALHAGRQRLQEILATARARICQSWQELDPLRTTYEKAEILGHVCEILRELYVHEPLFPVIPAGVLVCRGCGYSMNRLCEGPTSGEDAKP
jgi:hypothetical protein